MPGKHEREKVAGRVEIRDGEKIVAGKKGWERVAASKEMGRNMVGRKKIKQNKGIQMKKKLCQGTRQILCSTTKPKSCADRASLLPSV